MTQTSVTTGKVKSYRQAATAAALLIILPCLLSLINISFAQSWKLHFFPAAVMLAAIVFGARGGLAAGISGSLYTAIFLGNPYVIAGNALFGLLTGVFYKKTGKIIPAVLMAFACELPWLILSDYYLAGLDADFIAGLVVVLLLGNLLWAALINLGIKPINKFLSPGADS
ncbi:MAG TPA: hypothetical protein PKZ12_07840 [Smithellaceae bacterium]|nr:hypothetical protein [Smithellaceae bacterium]